ncbi:MAG: cytochrome c-type biogenesis protein CcmH [Chloroflexota bacterium]
MLPIAVAALLALAALVTLELVRPEVPVTQAEQADRIAAELRCPDCQSLSVAESQTAAAAAIRAQIVELLEAGASAQEVRDHFVTRYGEWILLTPVAPIAWWLPFAALLAGIALFAWWLRRSVPGEERPPRPPPDDATIRRVHDEVEQLDA